MKIEFKNSIVRLSFLCGITDIKIAWINTRKPYKFLSFKSQSPLYSHKFFLRNENLMSRISMPQILMPF